MHHDKNLKLAPTRGRSKCSIENLSCSNFILYERHLHAYADAYIALMSLDNIDENGEPWNKVELAQKR